MYKVKTGGVGCDGFHPKVHQDVTKETRGEIVEFLEKRNKPAQNDVLLDSEECYK